MHEQENADTAVIDAPFDDGEQSVLAVPQIDIMAVWPRILADAKRRAYQVGPDKELERSDNAS
ncbi:hypothetical protein [Paraburkholderia solisilvae]|uniref:Uncharacterized protein n=1 Tax=Paraburkholderia solisilvae TaxID=624376 RepID=A0A6J5EV66_9BURK|nr:hypothetical protein [Paraburkholderia solisilvae]CAB3770468.1 hypothetical protein LMG29739_05791 [Paraburkholderia solisilvae]